MPELPEAMTSPADYVRHGWALVPIPSGEKGPTSKEWNALERCVTTPAAAAKRSWQNFGLAHAYSGTCSIDIDDLESASAWLAERGINLAALLSDPYAVCISSGRPNRAKLLYRLAEPLPSKKIIEAKANIIDFRCSNTKGTTVQDVLPPSIHPDTGQPYVWDCGLVGDWHELPDIPAALLTVWQSLIADNTRTSPAEDTQPVDLDTLREKLSHRDPDVDRDSWVEDLAVIHWETRGSADGLELAVEWSARGEKFKGRGDVLTRWRSFHLNHPNPKTSASWRVDVPASPDDFDVVATEQPAPDEEVAAPIPVGVVPKAHHLCTDLANAHRIQRVFGKKLMVASGRFYYWSGTHWAPDEGEAYRCASRLSRIVRDEAKRAKREADEAFRALDPELLKAAAEHPVRDALDKTDTGAKAMRLQAAAEALESWSTKCEMKNTVDAALGLLRKLLTVDHQLLDRDPWALNCSNGTIDLRTGELRPHSPEDRITKLAPVAYEPLATAERFESFVAGITAGNAPLAAFLQRWFGYCATASVREQKLVVHVGAGANGKGTLLNAVADVMGEYAGTAAPGLLTSSNERHPTEIADLFGRRLVTASESDDGAVLREGFVKQATGGDTLKGRWMRADFFEFRPTHKLQLLTNHKPQIRGQDFGIWRRVLLVPYPLRFGTGDEIAEGRADALRDNDMAEALKKEREGVLRWIVDGAVLWFRCGLNPPDCVLAAGREYQSENDRVGQFVKDCCTVDREAWCPIAGDFGGIYPAYTSWCRDSGYQYLGRGRFIQELERVVPFLTRDEKRVRNYEQWRTTRIVKGVKLCGDVQ